MKKLLLVVLLIWILSISCCYGSETLEILENGTKVLTNDIDTLRQKYLDAIETWTEIATMPKSSKQHPANYPKTLDDICLPKEYVLIDICNEFGCVEVIDPYGETCYIGLSEQSQYPNKSLEHYTTKELMLEVLKLPFMSQLSAFNQNALPDLAIRKCWEYPIFDEFLHRTDTTETIFKIYKHAKKYKSSGDSSLFDIYQALSFLTVADQVINDPYTEEELFTLNEIYQNGLIKAENQEPYAKIVHTITITGTIIFIYWFVLLCKKRPS